MELSFGLFPSLLLLVVILVLLALLMRERRRHARFLGSLLFQAEELLEGRSSRFADEYGEGKRGQLLHLLNRLVRQLQNSRETLQRERVALEQTLSDISHQLKTPLTSISLYLELLQGELPDPEGQATAFIFRCEAEVRRMVWLTRGLLKMARIEAGTVQFRRSEILPAAPVFRAVSALELLDAGRRVHLETAGGSIPPIVVDPDWLAEALGNIIKNALEHSPPESPVIVSVSQTPLFLRYEIRDRGEGIPEHLLPRIFDRFYLAGNRVDMESVGLGLYLARLIVRALGGDIRVRSRPQEGSVFTVTLPY